MKFKPGDRICTRRDNPDGHTRIPVYLRGRRGVVEKVLGSFAFADAVVQGRRDVREPLYTVAFSAAELWGGTADPSQTLAADLFESYLEAHP